MFYGLILLLAVPLSLHQVYANDVWKALYSGRYLALFQQFPHHSAFTYSPVKPIVLRDTYNWLGNLALLGLYKVGGVGMMQAFRLGIVLFAVLLPLSLIEHKRAPILLLFTFCYMVGMKQKLLMRTAIFAVPGTVTLLWLLLRAYQEDASKLLWGLPVLFWFWSNMHGSYLVGLGLLILAGVGLFLDEFWLEHREKAIRSRDLGLVILVVLSVVILVKPYPDYTFPRTISSIGGRAGGAVASPLITMFSSGEKNGSSGTTDKISTESSPAEDGETSWLTAVGEGLNSLLFRSRAWRPGEFAFPLLSYSYLFVSMTLVLFPLGFAVFVLSPSDFRFFHFLPVLGAFVLSLTYLRTIGYFPLVVFPVTLHKARQGHFSSVKMGRMVQYASLVSVAILSLNLGYYMIRGRTARFFGIEKLELRQGFARRMSGKVPHYVLRTLPRERLFTQYNVSAYLIWKWWPYKKVFFDSKGSAYEDSFFREYGTMLPVELMKKYQLDYGVFPHQTPFLYAYFIPNDKWRLLAFDEGMIVIARASRLPRVEPLEAFLLTAGEFNRLRPRIQESIRGFFKFLHARRNLAKLTISEDRNVVREGHQRRVPGGKPGTASGR